jgi:SOS-response transcriptional repressor LexA
LPAKLDAKPEYSQRITRLLGYLGMKQVPFAEILDVDQGAVSNWVRGKNRPQPDKFIEMAGLAVGEEREWFLLQAGVKPSDLREMALDDKGPTIDSASPTVEIKIFKSAGAGSFRSVDETPDHVVAFPRAWLPTTQKLVGLVVEGNSMSPLIESGFIVIVDRTRRTLALALNHIVAASDGAGVAIRRLVKSGSGYWLKPQNLNADNEEVPVTPSTRIIGVVVKWIGQSPRM